MVLDHNTLGLENKFLEKRSCRILWVRKVYFTKSCRQIWVRANQPFIIFIHHIWRETVLWGAVFIIQTSDRMQYFTIQFFKTNCTQSIFRTTNRELLAKPLKKFPNHLYGQLVLTFGKRQICSASCGQLFEWTLTELRFNVIKNLLCLFFCYLMVV